MTWETIASVQIYISQKEKEREGKNIQRNNV